VSFAEQGSGIAGNLLVVSRFEDYAPLSQAPAAFLTPGGAGSGQVTLSSGAQLSYQPGLDLGLLAIEGSSVDEGRVLWVLGSSASNVNRVATLLTGPTFPSQNHNANLLLVQGDTVIRDEGAAAAAAIATPAVDPSQGATVAATGKGVYLYMILALLLLGLGLVLWEQVNNYLKGRRST
jgi:hypothetical protein